MGSDWETNVVSQTPLGRVGQVDDIAGVAAFLASNDAKWITGQLLLAGGGLR
jgi:3-oxoacyl-[acyl-carrier protein] reductase